MILFFIIVSNQQHSASAHIDEIYKVHRRRSVLKPGFHWCNKDHSDHRPKPIQGILQAE